MPRAKNTVETVQITISTTQRIRDLLESLTEDGMYGRNVAETASMLLQEKMRELRRQGGLIEDDGDDD